MRQSELYKDIVKKSVGVMSIEQEKDNNIVIDPSNPEESLPFANICTDGSLFTDSAIDSTIQMVQELQQRGFKFHIADSFYNLIKDVGAQRVPLKSENSVTLDFFAGKSSFGSLPNKLERIQDLNITTFDASEYNSEEYNKIYDVISSTLPTPDHLVEYRSSYREGGYRLADILFEEFIFGINMSPILSRIKKIVNRLSKAADYAIEVSRKYLQNIVETVSDGYSKKMEAIYNQLHRLKQRSRYRHGKHPDEPVRKIAVLREVVKDYPDTNWISYLLKTTPSATGSLVGTTLGGIPGGMAGAGTGGVIGHYFADP